MDKGEGREGAAARGAGVAKGWAKDALGAVSFVERAISDVLVVGADVDVDLPTAGHAGAAASASSSVSSSANGSVRPPGSGADAAVGAASPGERNGFGEPIVAVRIADPAALVGRCAALAAAGKRVTLFATASELAAVRPALRALAARRLPVVAHVVERSRGEALALGDVGWGLVLSSSVEESLDLALAARRAAEDCGTPFFVVHERAALDAIEPVPLPLEPLLAGFVGAPSVRLKAEADAAHAGRERGEARAFAERVPFALASAMRDLQLLTNRPLDVFERGPLLRARESGGLAEAPVVLLGLGELGDVALGAVDRLRAAGYEVDALKLVAHRPFPGPRLVKALGRAHAIVVVEAVDQPLAQSTPLACELKAAFADALTWHPDYPGLGRMPRVVSAALGASDEIEITDLEALVDETMAEERGKRARVLGPPEASVAAGIETASATAPRRSSRLGRAGDARTFVMRGRVRDRATAQISADVCAAVLVSLGLRVRASVRAVPAADGGGAAFDLVAGRERPRAVHAPHAIDLMAFDAGFGAAPLDKADAHAPTLSAAALEAARDASAFSARALARLAEEGTVAVSSAAHAGDTLGHEALSGLGVRSVVAERRARAVGWPAAAGADEADQPWLTAAAFAAIAMACAAPLDRRESAKSDAKSADISLHFARGLDPWVVGSAVSTAVATLRGDEDLARRCGERARRAFAERIEVPQPPGETASVRPAPRAS